MKNLNYSGQVRSIVLRLFASRSALALLLIGIALVVLYESMDHRGKEQGGQTSQCAVSSSMARSMGRYATGELASLSPAGRSEKIAKIKFMRPDGLEVGIEEFAGKILLVNLWATWCLPCRAEMPALDRLQALKGGHDFEVVAINIDTARLERRQAFLKEAGIQHLAFYSDKSAAVFQILKGAGKASGLPTTLLVGPDGCEIASMAGAAEWDSKLAVELVAELLAEWRKAKTGALTLPPNV